MRLSLGSSMRRAFTLLELVIVLGIILLLLGLVLGIGSIVVGQSEQRQLRSTMAIVDSAIAEFEAQTGRPIVFQGDSGDVWYHVGYRYDSNCNGGVGDVYYDVPCRPFDSVSAGGLGWTPEPNYSPWFDSATNRSRQWMSATIDVLEQNPTCAQMVAKADPSLVHAVQFREGSGSSSSGLRAIDIKEFVDPWGSQVVILYPGRMWVDCDANANVIRDTDGTIRTRDEQKWGICRNQRPLLVSPGPDGQIGSTSANPTSSFFQYTQDNVYSYEPAQP